ncbi:MAG: xanthine dehydrogenase family protein molybdopterin-binding subunit [Bryobacterales bacterium]|nr:xanthine dehydrogenase family protein molybdopterin-binding subunit [Bryobacterales bacterium]
MTTSTFSRRDLLKSGAAVLVGFTFAGRSAAQMAVGADAALGKPTGINDVDSFLAVHADGSVTVYTGKVDLGTGLRIAIRQMAAEELELPVERVNLVEGDTALTPDQGSTGGSTGLTQGGVQVRRAAATAREAFRNMTPADLASGKHFNMKVDPNAPLKDPKTYKVVSQPVLRPEVPLKATGRHVYVQDFTMAGMLHGRVIHPPVIGAKLMSVDESSIRSIPDVRAVRIESFLGVVAKDEWAAIRAARELKVTWSEGQTLPGSTGLGGYVRNAAVDRDETVINRGNTASAMTGAAKTFAASYYWPNQSHASLGPSCAVADMRDGGLTVWSSAQAPHNLRANMAKVFAVPLAKVRVVYMDGAGCYGGNGNDDVAADAVLLSRAVNAPVRVQWMRQDELGWDPKGPQQLIDLRAGLDAQGNIAAWEAEMWVPMNKPGTRPLLSIDAAGMAQDHGQGAGLMTQNADPPYAAGNVRVVAHHIKDTPLRPSNLRAPGKIANVFAVEAFTDELALAAGVDPVEYRLRGLKDPRAIEVIRRTADMFGWKPRPASAPRPVQGGVQIGYGFAYARYKQAENYVAMAMEVAVERTTGKVSVRRVACAHDCGLIVNPNALRNQVEGLIVQTLSRTLHEEVKFDRARVTSVDWVTYPILRFPDAPAIEVALINRPELPLYGAGEAAAVTVPGALANAIFDAAGARVRTAPFTPERVKTAIVGD